MSASTAPRLSGRGPGMAAWMDAPVSRRSLFGDDVWRLDIHVAGRSANMNSLRWDALLPDGSRLTDPQHAGLLCAAKQYCWSMALDPPNGHKRLSPSSLHTRGRVLRVLCGWMVSEGLTSFRDLDPSAVHRLIGWLRARPGKSPGKTLKPATIGSYLTIISDMYRQRAKLEDCPPADPFPGETASDAAGFTLASKGKIPFIPDALAVDLLSKALLWVENHAANILAASELRAQTFAEARVQGQSLTTARRTVEGVMRRTGVTGPDGRPFVTTRSILTATSRLADACFVLIAGFVGMRVSEILSMQVGAIELHPIGETGVAQAYIVARLFKTTDEPEGRVERWLAPAPVVQAVECLERIHAPLRAASGHRELFLAKSGMLGKVTMATNSRVAERLNVFAAHVGVPYHEGRQWRFSPHQFRKTFARFVARGDRSHLLALSDHFKHVSLAMTSRGYVGTDFELHELVDREGRIETAIALDHLLASDRLGGRMGERIAARNHAFRGRAGEQVRRDYVDFVLAETDLRIRGCDYGWCVFRAEVALCGGKIAPNEAGRSPSHAPSVQIWRWMTGTFRTGRIGAGRTWRCGTGRARSPEPCSPRRSKNATACLSASMRAGMTIEQSRTRDHWMTAQAENTARAYRAALNRLVEGKATHPALAGRPARITPAAVAREARRSRNPLYTTHRGILDEITVAAEQPCAAADLAATVARLRAANTELRAVARQHAEEKRQLASENLLLLHRTRAAEEKLQSASHMAAGPRR